MIGLSQLLRRSDSIRSVLMEAGERLVSANASSWKCASFSWVLRST